MNTLVYFKEKDHKNNVILPFALQDNLHCFFYKLKGRTDKMKSALWKWLKISGKIFFFPFFINGPLYLSIIKNLFFLLELLQKSYHLPKSFF